MNNIKKFDDYFKTNEGLVSWIKNIGKKKTAKKEEIPEKEEYNQEDDAIIKELIGKVKSLVEFTELDITIYTVNQTPVSCSVSHVYFYPSKSTLSALKKKHRDLSDEVKNKAKKDVVDKIKSKSDTSKKGIEYKEYDTQTWDSYSTKKFRNSRI